MADLENSLKNNFLIAMPALNDPLFHQSVVYLCEHSDQGAMGFIINRPSKIMLDELFDHIEIPHHNTEANKIPVLFGGPVAKNQGMVLHDSPDDLENSIAISDNIFLSGSTDLLKAIANQAGPNNILVTLGYASWTAGQLEQEILNNDWLTVTATSDILFHREGQDAWQQAASLLGIDIRLISDDVGRA